MERAAAGAADRRDPRRPPPLCAVRQRCPDQAALRTVDRWWARALEWVKRREVDEGTTLMIMGAFVGVAGGLAVVGFDDVAIGVEDGHLTGWLQVHVAGVLHLQARAGYVT